MANGLMPVARLCALCLVLTACGSDVDPAPVASAGTPSRAGNDSRGGGPDGAGSSSGGAPSAGKASVGGSGGGGEPATSVGGGAPRPVEGRSVYALECHGDSKDCNLAAVPCFGVGSATPNVAAGWACANRCSTSADCSDAPSGAEAQASCVSFTSASHCVLVCQNENQSFACPDGMSCYTAPKSPIGYCLWP